MSVNKEHPHVFIVPEDDANRQIADSFHRQVDWNRQRRMQVLPEAGGWTKVRDQFVSVHAREMRRCPRRFIVLLLDFDNDDTRFEHIRAQVPADLMERVFIIGTLSEPEALRQVVQKSFEEIGSALAQDCRDDTKTLWEHELLQRNSAELARLRQHVRPILFPAS